jgi:hypothetical protein
LREQMTGLAGEQLYARRGQAHGGEVEASRRATVADSDRVARLLQRVVVVASQPGTFASRRASSS